MLVDTNIPGGNGLTEVLDGDVIRVRPDLRTTVGPWFWWHIRVRDCAGRRLRLELPEPNTTTVRGAVISRDQGRTWAWIPDYDAATQAMTIAAGADDELRLALAIPYTRRDLDAWLAWHGGHPDLTVGTLCQARSGAAVPLLTIGRQDGAEVRQAFFACRNHACESLASFALEGLLDAVLADDDAGRRLRARWRILVVPMVDYDGVQAGDQGKNRHPHDHNRDYQPPHLYPETAALRDLVRQRCDGRLHLALDLHCPWVRGGLADGHTNQHIYMVGVQDEQRARRQQEFAALLEAQRTGPLPYYASGTVSYGTGWNTGLGFSEGSTCAGCVAQIAPASCTIATFEIPYADAEGVMVDAQSARAFGRDLARAMDTLDAQTAMPQA
jgi:hypothetical protein